MLEKSFIATAIGYKACMSGYKVMYFNINKLFSKLKMAKADGTYLKEIDRIEKQDLIILDNFGLQTLDNLKSQYFMEIIDLFCRITFWTIHKLFRTKISKLHKISNARIINERFHSKNRLIWFFINTPVGER